MTTWTGVIEYPQAATDSYWVYLEAGHTYFIDMTGGAPSEFGPLSDPVLFLFGSGRIPLAVDDDGGIGDNARIVYTSNFTGFYRIDASAGPDSFGGYYLSINEDDFRGDISGSGPIGTVATAGSATGVLNFAEDGDMFQTTLVRGLTYTIEQRGLDSGSGTVADPALTLYGSGGIPAQGIYGNGVGRDSLATFKAGLTGTYYVEARQSWLLGEVPAPGTYRVVVSEGRGTSGADTIVASGVADAINGLGGADNIRGLAGADRITGSTGADVLIGGLGGDTFRFLSGAESVGTARDQIRAGDSAVAFEGAGAAAGDRIDLAGIDANTGVSGNQAFLFGGSGRGHLTLATEGTNTVIHGNTDSDAAYEFDLVIVDGSVAASAYKAVDFVL